MPYIRRVQAQIKDAHAGFDERRRDAIVKAQPVSQVVGIERLNEGVDRVSIVDVDMSAYTVAKIASRLQLGLIVRRRYEIVDRCG